ncbi:MAG TPA: TIGR03936 family radical SAM-associated protein, partial [Ilumatobacteraceae bacterium]|nr:TIGR03936 family radical SAM-associated protein [Ilumatobacteraceae bacterium]
HIDIGFEEDFLASEYRKAVGGRASPPCGKPFGAKVHHRTVEEAQAEARRLVCYDCGIACDMSHMRDERIVALRGLEEKRAREAEVVPSEAASSRPSGAGGVIVPLSRLVGRLPSSNLDDTSAFKEAAEAPHSRLRLVFGKHGALRFLSHLDLLRIVPRMFRRAGVELGFTRGWNPVPRMTFGPALALGMAADEEVVDVDVVVDVGAEVVGGGSVDPLAADSPVEPVELVSSSPVHAARAAPIVPARNPRRVSRGRGGGSLTTPSIPGGGLGSMDRFWRR